MEKKIIKDIDKIIEDLFYGIENGMYEPFSNRVSSLRILEEPDITTSIRIQLENRVSFFYQRLLYCYKYRGDIRARDRRMKNKDTWKPEFKDVNETYKNIKAKYREAVRQLDMFNLISNTRNDN